MKRTRENLLFNVFAIIITSAFALMCVLPMLYTLSGSFTKEQALYGGLKLIPAEFSLDAYRMVLKEPGEMLNAYGVTILVVCVGTAASLIITTMTAYVLYRKDFKYRNVFSFFFFFTTLFSGGLVPSYILITKMGLKNTLAVLLLNNLFSVFNMIVTRSYFTGNIPSVLVESAKIDGADDFRIYWRIVMPAAKPILATIGLLVALAYWNEWYNAMLYITDKKLYPLQYYLYNIFNSAQLKNAMAEAGAGASTQMPKEGYKLAMTIFTTGPIVLLYPFVQKYFVAGMTIGAVKG